MDWDRVGTGVVGFLAAIFVTCAGWIGVLAIGLGYCEGAGDGTSTPGSAFCNSAVAAPYMWTVFLLPGSIVLAATVVAIRRRRDALLGVGVLTAVVTVLLLVALITKLPS